MTVSVFRVSAAVGAGLALALIGPGASAQPVDGPALRAAVQFPALPAAEGSIIGPRARHGLPAEAMPGAGSVSALRKAMTGTPEDADLYSRLGSVYDALREPQRARDAYRRAADHYRARLDATPTDRTARVRLGAALAGAGRHEEGCAVLEGAVEAAPDDATAWLALAECHTALACLAVWDQARPRPDLPPGDLLDGPVAPARREAATTHLREAARCYGQAVDHAGPSWQPFFARGLFAGLVQPIVAATLDAAADAPTLRDADMRARAMVARGSGLGTAALADLDRAASLAPDDTRAQGTAALLHLVAVRAAGEGDADPVGRLQPDARRAVDAQLAALNRIAQATDAPTKAAALATLGVLDMARGMLPRSEERLRQAIQVDPQCVLAWDALTGLLSRGDRDVDLAVLLEERVTSAPSARVHLALARVHQRAGRREDAEKQVRAAIADTHDDVHANLCLAALVLQASDGDAAAAERHLSQAADAMRDAPNGTAWSDLNALRGVARGLRGETAAARELLGRVLAHAPDHVTARLALAALGRPAPAPRAEPEG